MKKPITWYALCQRIGKQTIHDARTKYVEVMIDGSLRQCKLVYSKNGKDWFLEPI